MILRLAAALVLTAVLSVSAFARDFTEAEKDGLAERVASFNAAMSASDWIEVMGVVPPRVLDKIASDFGVEVEALRQEMVAFMDETMAQVSIESFGMAVNETVYTATPDGTPYALIPTETVIDMGEAGKMKTSNTTVGILDEDQWYLVRTDDAQTIAVLRAVYPAFAEVELPAGTTEIIE